MTRAETAAFLCEHDNYCILTHRRPDGDTIGSSAALCLGLRAMGKTAWLLRNPQFTPRFAAVLEGLVCEDVPDEATIVSVDVAAPDLLPIGREGLAEQVQLVIDHHARSSVSAEHRLVEAERAACGEIIFGLLELLGVSPDARMAEAIYIAVSTDTGCFQYSNTTADTLRIAAACKDAGADTYPINKLFFGTKSFARLKLEARLTGSAEFYADGKVALVELPQAWLDELGASEDDVDSIAGFARAIEGVELGITVRDVEGGNGKLSLRTGGSYDACKLCQELGGGGHAAAAGATVPGGIAGAKRAILDVLRRKGII